MWESIVSLESKVKKVKENAQRQGQHHEEICQLVQRTREQVEKAIVNDLNQIRGFIDLIQHKLHHHAEQCEVVQQQLQKKQKDSNAGLATQCKFQFFNLSCC